MNGVGVNSLKKSLFVSLDKVDKSIGEVVVFIVVAVSLVVLNLNISGSVGNSLSVFILKFRVESRLEHTKRN